jgi:hypothetical protein
MKIKNIPRIDINAGEAGKWFDYPKAAGVRFRVRRATSATVQDAKKSFIDQIGARGVPLTSEQLEQLGIIVSVAALADWEGILDENDKPIPHSDDVAREVLSNPEYEELLTFISVSASDIDNYRAEAIAKEKKPSKRGQRGKRRTATT